MIKQSFRWYGEHDPVKLEDIRVIPGIEGIVTAVYDVPVGEAWPLENIMKLKERVEGVGLEISVIESIPVHEDIKQGKPSRDRLIENYKESIRNVGKAGITRVCYNFMPVFDWTRSNLNDPLPDGSESLSYIKKELENFDPAVNDLNLPGWDSSYTKEELLEIFDNYRNNITEEILWENIEYFIKEIIPVAEEAGVHMAIHPDDPPYGIFGLPRIITGLDAVKRFLDIYDSPHHGLTVCVGSYASDPANNAPEILEYGLKRGRVHFVHSRNVVVGDWGFQESGHLSAAGDIDMNAVAKLLAEYDFDGAVRPDHGRVIWGDQQKTPGYGLYDRALGLTYFNGLYEANMKALGKDPRFGIKRKTVEDR